MRTWSGQLTRAEVNTGKIVVPGAPGRVYTVVDCWMRAIGGAAGSNTSVDVTDDTTGTVAASFEDAALSQNAVCRIGAANTSATGLNTALAQGEGLKVANVGTAMDTATHLDVCIHYIVSSVHAVSSGW
jgi:hypothetical protein